jgi:hypothetical protein
VGKQGRLIRLSAWARPAEIASKLADHAEFFVYPIRGLTLKPINAKTSLLAGPLTCPNVASRGYRQLSRAQIEGLLTGSRGRVEIESFGAPFKKGARTVVEAPSVPMRVRAGDLWVFEGRLVDAGLQWNPPPLAREVPTTVSERTNADAIFQKILVRFIFQHDHLEGYWTAAEPDEPLDAVAERLWRFMAKSRAHFRNRFDNHISWPASRKYLRMALDPASDMARQLPSAQMISAVLRSSFKAWPKRQDLIKGSSRTARVVVAYSDPGSPLRLAPDGALKSASWDLQGWSEGPIPSRAIKSDRRGRLSSRARRKVQC